MPRVSIILPTYNGAASITRSIESVLAQTYTSFELIVVDDGSTDATLEILEVLRARDTRIVVISNAYNQGLQRSLRNGIACATGEYIARIDDDDIWVAPEKLALQSSFLDEHPECVLVGTNAEVMHTDTGSTDTYTLPQSDPAIRVRMLAKNCFIHSSVLIRKDALDQVGGYREHMEVRHIEDYDLWLRLGLVGSLANLSLYAVRLYRSDKSITGRYHTLQARRILALIPRYKKSYPRFWIGYVVAVIRYAFFWTLDTMPYVQKHLRRIVDILRTLYKKL